MHITVTKPYLPAEEKYLSLVKKIWQRNWLTNNGPLVNRLELALKEYLDLDHLLYLTNGTAALQLAIKVLSLKGEVITTPFSYVATTSSAVWEGLKPIFVDINPETYNIDTSKIEEKITSETTGILATHVFGNLCEIDEINRIAKKHDLKVIYDASHCFGVRYKGKSVYQFGDISTASFHATKIYHSVEGGAVISRDKKLIKQLAYMRNFGHSSYESFASLGINAKNSEFHAAMGLAVLEDIEEILACRKKQFLLYRDLLKTHRARQQVISYLDGYNYSYFSLLFDDEQLLKRSIEILESNGISPRRYFYPTLNKLPYVSSQECPEAEAVSSKILCLPLYHDLSEEEQELICRLLLRVQNS